MPTELIYSGELLARVSEFDNAEIARKFTRDLGMGFRAAAPEYNVTAWGIGAGQYHWAPIS